MSSNYFGLMDELVGIAAIWIAIICFAGLRSNYYRDNWAQTIGLSMMLIGALVLSWYAFATHRSSWRAALFVVGCATYLTGVAWNAWRFRGAPPQVVAPDTEPQQ